MVTTRPSENNPKRELRAYHTRKSLEEAYRDAFESAKHDVGQKTGVCLDNVRLRPIYAAFWRTSHPIDDWRYLSTMLQGKKYLTARVMHASIIKRVETITSPDLVAMAYDDDVYFTDYPLEQDHILHSLYHELSHIAIEHRVGYDRSSPERGSGAFAFDLTGGVRSLNGYRAGADEVIREGTTELHARILSGHRGMKEYDDNVAMVLALMEREKTNDHIEFLSQFTRRGKSIYNFGIRQRQQSHHAR